MSYGDLRFMIRNIVKEIDDNYKFYFAVAFRHLKNHEDAYDAVQNACLKICKYCPEYLPSKKLRAWISIVCSNEAKTLLVTNKKYSQSDRCIFSECELISPYGNPEDLEFYYEGVTYAAIQIAPAEYRMALYNYYTGGLSLLSVAQKYNVPESNLRYWRRKVEKKLKEFL